MSSEIFSKKSGQQIAQPERRLCAEFEINVAGRRRVTLGVILTT